MFGLEAGHSHLVQSADRQAVADSFHSQAVAGRTAAVAGDSHLELQYAGSHPVNNIHTSLIINASHFLKRAKSKPC